MTAQGYIGLALMVGGLIVFLIAIAAIAKRW